MREADAGAILASSCNLLYEAKQRQYMDIRGYRYSPIVGGSTPSSGDSERGIEGKCRTVGFPTRSLSNGWLGKVRSIDISAEFGFEWVSGNKASTYHQGVTYPYGRRESDCSCMDGHVPHISKAADYPKIVGLIGKCKDELEFPVGNTFAGKVLSTSRRTKMESDMKKREIPGAVLGVPYSKPSIQKPTRYMILSWSSSLVIASLKSSTIEASRLERRSNDESIFGEKLLGSEDFGPAMAARVSSGCLPEKRNRKSGLLVSLRRIPAVLTFASDPARQEASATAQMSLF
ncbi:hypothetical protein BKA70DRAFT_1240476 [Coprinopsis sp. MPI-PUGE-AT-0042]|nr:hypothetical protein BKA70DRAFT_1240476 [Coprinopsis sp. MPI-PUGE-AT-0042]